MPLNAEPLPLARIYFRPENNDIAIGIYCR
jgi:hypothetical protein